MSKWLTFHQILKMHQKVFGYFQVWQISFLANLRDSSYGWVNNPKICQNVKECFNVEQLDIFLHLKFEHTQSNHFGLSSVGQRLNEVEEKRSSSKSRLWADSKFQFYQKVSVFIPARLLLKHTLIKGSLEQGEGGKVPVGTDFGQGPVRLHQQK